jgi:pimeloyl-ACP methyl ester carboxylesterase
MHRDHVVTLHGPLARRFHVLALDQRGHGDSDPAPAGDYEPAALAGDLAAFADALALPSFHVVALSMGGRVAIAYTARHPAKVERLVIVDIGPDIAPAGRARIGTAMTATPERFATAEEAFAWLRAGNARSTERSLRLRVEHGLRPTGDGGFAWKYDHAIRAGRWREVVDLWPDWQAITRPTLLIRGAESDVLAPETPRGYHGGLAFRRRAMSAMSLRRPAASLFLSSAARPMKLTVRPSTSAGARDCHASSKVRPEISVKTSTRRGGTPIW